jgi:NAD-dependent dihydropyrimidine dehydrogenase PreA subunit
VYDVTVDAGKCDGCEECVNICPSEVFQIVEEKSDPYQTSECAYCLSCIEACPNSAIIVNEV